mgnify:CR=1 FL=1
MPALTSGSSATGSTSAMSRARSRLIPAAINEFTALFRKLVLKLVNDPEFRTAVAP